MNPFLQSLESRRLFAVALPAQIELEDFIAGAEGVAYHDLEAQNLGNDTYRPGTGVDLQKNTDGAAGHSVGYVKAGEWLKYSASVAQAGAYNIDFRVADQGLGGKFHLEVDGVNVTGSMQVPSTTAWAKYQTITKTNINLTAGTHTLRLYMETNGYAGYTGDFNWMKFSKVVVTPPPPPPPPGQTPFKTVTLGSASGVYIEAENFDNGGQGVAYNDLETANLGNDPYRAGAGVDLQTITDGTAGHAITSAKPGEWVEYTVNVATAGSYTFDFRFATAGIGGKFHLDVDGVNVTRSMPLPNSGNAASYLTTSKAGIILSAGTHLLRVGFDTNSSAGYVANFNWMKATPAPVPPTPPKRVLPGLYADPTLVSYNGTYYMYPTTDGTDGWNGTYFTAWSSPDLVNWTNRGTIFSLSDTTWAKAHAWAPAIATKNGKYYFYFAGDSQIGVAVSDSPIGPFKDPLGKPLVAKGAFDCQAIDPMVFIDDDGSAYLYFGQRNCFAVKLNPDMISFDPTQVKKITPPGYNEGSFMFKRNGKYYLSWSEYDTRDPRYSIAYATSSSPLGPFTKPAGNPILIGKYDVQGAGHHSVMQIPGTDQWYIAYHRFAIPGGDGYHRESCIATLHFDASGNILPVDPYEVISPV